MLNVKFSDGTNRIKLVREKKKSDNAERSQSERDRGVKNVSVSTGERESHGEVQMYKRRQHRN